VSGSFNAAGSIKVAVRPPFQVIPSVNSVTLTPGSSANVNLTIAATAGFNSPVALNVTGLPTGVTGVFTPTNAAPGTAVILKLTAAPTAPTTTTATTVASIIKGTSGALSVQTPLAVGVSTASFELTATPAALTVNRGETATFNFGITTTGSFAQPIGLEFAGLPATATGSTSSAGAGKFALKIVTKPTTTAQTYNITLTGTSGALRKATTVKLTVK
jgi:hypothetical protein